MTTLTKTKGPRSRAALQNAMACAILCQQPSLSIYTREALRSVGLRLLDGEAIPRDEWNAVRYAYFASLKD